ncbi:hypothetical protein HGRIS_012712 [Hohenbuehelia grisea]|uniref:Uncharacterized protein n=1 Tax=Hohenbuehelia grisea TaxID=104357 RepID=A0ABR3ITB8_9AGAR
MATIDASSDQILYTELERRDEALRGILENLHSFLASHAEEVRAVKQQFSTVVDASASRRCDQFQRNSQYLPSEIPLQVMPQPEVVQPIPVDEPTPSPNWRLPPSTSRLSPTQRLLQPTADPEESRITLVQDFLEDHLRSVHSLCTALSDSKRQSYHGSIESTSTSSQRPVSPSHTSHESIRVHVERPTGDAEEQMKSFSHQYSILVVFSTFTAGLVLSWLQLMSGILPPPDEKADYKEAIHYVLGFQFGYTALVFNFAIAVVAGADTAACTSGKAWKSLPSLRKRFNLLVFAQFIGYVLFGISIGTLLVPAASLSIVIMTMVVLPIAIITAGSDLANTSKEVRYMREDIWSALCTFFSMLTRCFKRS